MSITMIKQWNSNHQQTQFSKTNLQEMPSKTD